MSDLSHFELAAWPTNGLGRTFPYFIFSRNIYSLKVKEQIKNFLMLINSISSEVLRINTLKYLMNFYFYFWTHTISRQFDWRPILLFNSQNCPIKENKVIGNYVIIIMQIRNYSQLNPLNMCLFVSIIMVPQSLSPVSVTLIMHNQLDHPGVSLVMFKQRKILVQLKWKFALNYESLAWHTHILSNWIWKGGSLVIDKFNLVKF